MVGSRITKLTQLKKIFESQIWYSFLSTFVVETYFIQGSWMPTTKHTSSWWMHQEASSWLVGNWVIGIGLNISRIQSLPNHVAVDLASHPAIDSFLTDRTLTPHWKVTPKKIHPKIALFFSLVIILWVKKGMDQNKHLVLPTAYVMFNFIGSSRPRPPGAALRVTRKRSHASPCVRRQPRWCMPCSQPARWLRSMLPGCVDSGGGWKRSDLKKKHQKKMEILKKMAQENVNCWILKLVRSNYI